MAVRIETPRLTDGVSRQPPSRRFRSQAEEIKNGMMRIIDGADKRNGTFHVAQLLAADVTNFRIHWMDRDDDHQYVFVTTNSNSTGTARLRAFDLTSGTEIHIEDYASASAGGTLGGAAPLFTYLAASTDPFSDFCYLTIADTTFIADRRKITAMDTAVKTSAATVQPYGKGFVFIKQGAYSTDYILTIKHGATTSTITTTTWDGTGSAGVGEIASINTHDIAADLATQINAIVGLTATQNGPVLEIVGDNGSHIITEMTAIDGLGNSAMSLLFESISTAVDLPLTCRDGFKIRVSGDAAIGGDDYYIKFVADVPSAFGPGTWEQTLGHDNQYQFDATTMPHRIIRTVSSGGGVLPSGYLVDPDETYFEFRDIDWNERLVGDQTTNPNPSFIDSSIQNISFFKNRLVFESDDNTICSEVNVYYNFFRTDMVNLLDSDPIDVGNGYPAVTLGKWAEPFESDLILFSDRTQFRIPGDEVVTPKTVGILPISSYKMDTLCKPVPTGTGLLFSQRDGNYSRIMELFRRGNSDLFEAVDLTEQCPDYIAGRVQQITVSPEIEMAVILPYTPGSVVYVYQYHWSGDKRVQSAWSHWDFGEDAVVRSAQFYRDRLFFVITRGSRVFLEYIDLGYSGADSPQTYRVKMDRKFTVTSGTYNLMTNLTSLNLPFVLGANETVQVLTTSAETPGGLPVAVDSVDIPGNKVYVIGDFSTKDMWVGVKYDWEYTLGDILVKEPTETGEHTILDGPCQVLRGLLAYESSGPFKVTVTNVDGLEHTYPFTGRSLGQVGSGEFTSTQPITSGEFQFPVMYDGRSCTIKIINEKPFPSKIQKVEWFLNVSPTAKGM